MTFGKPVHEECLTMTSLKTGYLLFLAAFLFLSIVPTVAEVVRSVAACNQYLLQGTPPQLPGILEGGNILNQNRYKPICQTYENQTRFLTLYDITNKIPVFSAYKYTGVAETAAVGNDWKIEPQLDEEKNETNNDMKEEERGQTYNNQAIITDHSNDNTYDKGHLNPSTHGSTTADKESTYTLTNIVPQAKDFNQKRWNKMEGCIECVMKTFCKDNNTIEGFVVTGAQPSYNKTLNNKVNVPSIVWSGFCCHHTKKRDMWIASAHWDNNVGEGPEYLQSQTLTALHNTLGEGANLFPGTPCPLGQTLGDYRGLKITQTCPNCR